MNTKERNSIEIVLSDVRYVSKVECAASYPAYWFVHNNCVTEDSNGWDPHIVIVHGLLLVCSSVNDHAIKAHVLPKLFNFLAWCTWNFVGISYGNYVGVNENLKGKLFSIAQNLVYLGCNGRKDVPKHNAFGMAVRHLPGSSEMAGMLNGLGKEKEGKAFKIMQTNESYHRIFHEVDQNIEFNDASLLGIEKFMCDL